MGSKTGIDPCKVDGDLANSGKSIHDLLSSQMSEIEMDIFSFKTPALIDLGLNASGDNVPGTKFHELWGIAFHKTFPLRIEEISSFSSGCLRDQDICSIKAGGMELDKFHILEGNTRLVGQITAAARIDDGIG